MPYLLPDLPFTDVYTCKRIYVPDAPEYRVALLGSLDFFSKWLAWQDEGSGNAKIAADVWKVALAMTHAVWEQGCDDEMPTCDELRAIISEELEKMTINNCINVSCGGCGCNGLDAGSGVDQFPPPDYEDPTDPLPEPIIPPQTISYNEFKCSRSYWLHYEFRNACLQLGTLVDTAQAGYEETLTAVEPLTGLALGIHRIIWEYYQVLMLWAVNAFTSDTSSAIVSAVTAAQSDFVCALFGSDGVNDARDRFKAVIDNLPLSWAGRYWLSLIEQNIIYANWLYPANWESIQIPVPWQGRDCTCTGSAGSLPDLPVSGEYILVPIEDGEWVDTPNNASADVTFSEPYSRFNHVALNDTLNYHQTSVALDVDAIVSRAGALSAHGMVFQFVEPIIGGVDNRVNLRLSTGTGGTVEFEAIDGNAIVSFQGDEYSTFVDFSDYIDSFLLSQVYGNGELVSGSAKASFGSESYLFDMSYTFGVRVWVVCKVAL